MKKKISYNLIELYWVKEVSKTIHRCLYNNGRIRTYTQYVSFLISTRTFYKLEVVVVPPLFHKMCVRVLYI